MRARQEFVNALDLPANWEVIPFARSVDRIDTKAIMLMVWVVSIKPSPQFQAYEVELAVMVLVPKQDPGESDDQLDDALSVLISAVDKLPFANWSDASRGVMSDTWHNYQMAVQLRYEKEDS